MMLASRTVNLRSFFVFYAKICCPSKVIMTKNKRCVAKKTISFDKEILNKANKKKDHFI